MPCIDELIDEPGGGFLICFYVHPHLGEMIQFD